MSAARIATVGVYGFTWDQFLAALRSAGVALVIDVRQRRGVRGSEYAWANAARLTRGLEDAGIAYRHELALAPTTEMRQLQYREDDKLGVGKRSREHLAEGYVEAYTREILDPYDLDGLAAELPANGVAALLCVERDPEACHRGLIAARLAGQEGLQVIHLRP